MKSLQISHTFCSYGMSCRLLQPKICAQSYQMQNLWQKNWYKPRWPSPSAQIILQSWWCCCKVHVSNFGHFSDTFAFQFWMQTWYIQNQKELVLWNLETLFVLRMMYTAIKTHCNKLSLNSIGEILLTNWLQMMKRARLTLLTTLNWEKFSVLKHFSNLVIQSSHPNFCYWKRVLGRQSNLFLVCRVLSNLTDRLT